MLSFEELKKIVLHATSPQGSPFYRSHYGIKEGQPARTIHTEEEWLQLPPVTKDDLIAMPLRQRSFVPLGTLDHLRTSSGTSGKPPLFSPRTHVRNMEYRLQYHDFSKAFMCYTVPLMPHWHERFLMENGRNACVINYDPRAPKACAKLARIANVDAISLFVYHVQDAGEALKAEGINTQIRFLEITGELCTRALYEYMRETFPNAIILQSYNSSEVEDAHIGMPCKAMDGTEPLAVYHPKKTHFLELIDKEHNEILQPVAGAEGDLLVTSYPGEPSSFPLIRFRIGDTVRIVEQHCPHGSWSFTVLGRTDMDFLKVAGGVLRADEIARVLNLFPDRVTDRFSLRNKELLTDRGPLPAPVLEVETRGEVDFVRLASDIEAQLRVGPSLTWRRGVEEGRYVPLTCVPLTDAGGKKQRRIIAQ